MMKKELCQQNLLVGSFPGSKRKHGRPQTFFQGRTKFSRGGGQKHTIFHKNALKHNILVGQVGGVPPLALPADAHERKRSLVTFRYF